MPTSATTDKVSRVEAQLMTMSEQPWVSLRFHTHDQGCSTIFLNTRAEILMTISALEAVVHKLPEDPSNG